MSEASHLSLIVNCQAERWTTTCVNVRSVLYFYYFFILFLFTEIYFEKHKDLSLYLDLSKNTFTAKFYTTPRENEEIFRIH